MILRHKLQSPQNRILLRHRRAAIETNSELAENLHQKIRQGKQLTAAQRRMIRAASQADERDLP
jgi:hypothetical protein